jgi:hypothetical protein
MTSTMTLIAIGPWLMNISMIQPMTGRSSISFGRSNDENVPAPRRGFGEMRSRFR